MKKGTIVVAACLFAVGAVQAAVAVEWKSVGAAGPAVGSSDESSVSTEGTLAYAYNLGAINTLTAHSVTFEGTGAGNIASIGGGNITFSPAHSGGSHDFNNLTSNLGILLDSARWATEEGETVTLNNLVAGQRYLVQLYFSDTRADRNNTLILDSNFEVGYIGDDNGGTGRYAIGRFTADAAGQATFFYDYEGRGHANLNLIQVRVISGRATLGLISF